MRHHLELARTSILAAALLFLLLAALFSIEHKYTGRATAGSTANITAAAPANCTFAPGAGYNIISIPCINTAVALSNVTSGTQVYVMYQYVPGDPDLWRVYHSDLPSYVVSDLQFLSRRPGYVTWMNSSANKTIEGIRVAQTDVPIIAGWNLVGYPSNRTRNLTDVLGPINTSFNLVVAYNKSGEAFVTYPGSLDIITPGEGYWINGTAAATWAVS